MQNLLQLFTKAGITGDDGRTKRSMKANNTNGLTEKIRFTGRFWRILPFPLASCMTSTFFLSTVLESAKGGKKNQTMLLNNAESADLLKTRAMLVSKTVNTLHHCLLLAYMYHFLYISHTENAKYFLGIKLFWRQLCFH